MISKDILNSDKVYFLTNDEKLELIKSKGEFDVMYGTEKGVEFGKVKKETLIRINAELQLTGAQARSIGYPVAFYLGEVCYFLKCEVRS